MNLDVAMPRLSELVPSATVHAVACRPGDAIAPGSALVALTLDLGAVAAQDCPPVSRFRIVSRERAFIRRIDAVPGGVASPGDVLIVATPTGDEPLDAGTRRALRTNCISVYVDPLA